MPQEVRLALFGGVLPGLITGVALLLLWWWHAKRAARHSHDSQESDAPTGVGLGPVWAAPITLALGYMLADFATNGVPKLWPDGNNYRFPHVALALGLLGVIEALLPLRGLARALALSIVRVAVLAGCAWMIGEGYYDAGSRSGDQFYGWMAVVAVGGAVAMALADRAAGVLSARVLGFLIALVGAGLIPVFFLTGSALLAQSSASVIAFGTAAALAAWIVCWLQRSADAPAHTKLVRLDRGAMTVVTGLVVIPALAVSYQTYPAAKGPAALVLIGLAPAMLGLVLIGARPSTDDLRHEKLGTAGPARIVAVAAALLLTIGLALGVAQLGQPVEDESEDDASYEYYPE